ncbi:MAG: hypothetical protein K0R57_1642 [Paenibacillaceae bacterium]|jgi:glycosyltransferase involved in cell wall biosynthesis|nr:hypothetical protein [Paenibacillaceae bacterium]
MKLMFSFYMPSGGMGTLNQIRKDAFLKQGHNCHLLYTSHQENGNPEFLREWLKKEQFDIITVASDYTMLEKIRKAGYSGPLVYEVQGYGPPAEGQKVMVSARNYIHSFADAVLYPCTSHLASLFLQHVPQVPQYSFDNPVDSTLMRYRRYPPRATPILGWVGRIEYNKNWRELLELVRRLVWTHPNLRVWMFGDHALDNQWEYSQFDATVKAYGLSSHIIRHTNVPNALMADYYSIIGDSGGFLCSTSLLEGFGYSICEAMLCRCPVLSSTSDGVNRMIINHKTGMLYRSGDVNDAYNTARILLENAGFRQQIRRSGMLHIRKRFRPERYVANFEEMVMNLRRKMKLL